MSTRHRVVRVLLFLGAITAAGAATPASISSSAPPGEGTVYTVTLDSVIHPVAARFLEDAIDKANERKALLVIIKLDTPGGLVTSMEAMVKSITTSRVP